jgi:hypothetical protein
MLEFAKHAARPAATVHLMVPPPISKPQNTGGLITPKRFLAITQTGQSIKLVPMGTLPQKQSTFVGPGPCLTMTVSIGIAYAREAALTSDALFASADEALYAAKNGDRDTFKVMECNVIDLARRPSRRRSDAGQRSEVGASWCDS